MITTALDTIINLVLAGSLLLTTASSLAQPVPTPAEPIASQDQKTEPAATPPAPKSAPAAGSKSNRQPDVFIPSEEISEDLSVSFPEDI